MTVNRWEPAQQPERIPQRSDIQVPPQTTILVSRQSSTVHIIHAVLTLLSLGTWAPIWITYAIVARQRTLTVTLNSTGNVIRAEYRK